MEKVKEFFKKYFSVAKMVFIVLGLVFGFVPMLTESEAEYNWVFAFIACAIMCAFLEAMRAVMVKPKVEEDEEDKEEKVKKPRYDWHNPVLALVATAISIGICLLL
ncbi:hypothetical protein [Hoylesella loescheii]|uniref:Uncharacterized protein n=1 Tax=Hoylesella loescheii DSM 19665 = JCM 12249 = ATCC 15930 TaxID=1122985 RepID=A0A069QHW3_HOYLO|nr:hypothetical protein [Hoylesella loescheii]KDR52380.1 hypothetical protein HMPREF1991_01563 [Hoylesella loescheii DSM 19665 = JCM 12249 = ATCC 15930]